MKKLLFISVLILNTINFNLSAQESDKESSSGSAHGNTLNIGIGGGYRGYIGRPVSFILLNYEFDVAKNFTLAPFIGFYSYSNSYYWGNKNYPYRNYSYRETVVPLGVKGAFYFDDLLHAGNKWDFYGAASLGFAIRTVTWDNDYYGDRNGYQRASPLYLAAHLGARYHITQKVGIFLDLSTAFSTFGLSFKL